MDTLTQTNDILSQLKNEANANGQRQLLELIDDSFSQLAEDQLGIRSFFSISPQLYKFVSELYKSGRSEEFDRDFLMTLHEYLSLADSFATLHQGNEQHESPNADPLLADLPDKAADALLTLDYLLSWHLRRNEYFADLTERKLLSADYSLAVMSQDERFEPFVKKQFETEPDSLFRDLRYLAKRGGPDNINFLKDIFYADRFEMRTEMNVLSLLLLNGDSIDSLTQTYSPNWEAYDPAAGKFLPEMVQAWGGRRVAENEGLLLLSSSEAGQFQYLALCLLLNDKIDSLKDYPGLTVFYNLLGSSEVEENFDGQESYYVAVTAAQWLTSLDPKALGGLMDGGALLDFLARVLFLPGSVFNHLLGFMADIHGGVYGPSDLTKAVPEALKVIAQGNNPVPTSFDEMAEGNLGILAGYMDWSITGSDYENFSLKPN